MAHCQRLNCLKLPDHRSYGLAILLKHIGIVGLASPPAVADVSLTKGRQSVLFGWTFLCREFVPCSVLSPSVRQSPLSIQQEWRLSSYDHRLQHGRHPDRIRVDQLILGGTLADSIGSQYSNSCLAGSDGNDTFFVNSTVLGVGAGTTLTGTLGQTASTSAPTALRVSSYSPTRTTTRSVWLELLPIRASMEARERTAFSCATR